LKELLQLLTKEEEVSKLIDLMYMVRNNNVNNRIPRIFRLIQVDNLDVNPIIDLEIDRKFTPQVVFDFSLQVNILLRSIWIKMGWHQLSKSGVYLKLADQHLIEPIGVWKNFAISIMGIPTQVDFEIINPKETMQSFAALVGQNLMTIM